MRKLSADHPLDVLELQWALSIRSASCTLKEIAQASGRPLQAWADAIDAGEAAWPPDEVIEQRFDLVREAVIKRLPVGQIALFARAPKSWCAEVVRRLPQMDAERPEKCPTA